MPGSSDTTDVRLVRRMPPTAAPVVAALAVVLLASAPAWAQAAAPPADRCEGTLCDLYYASRPGPAATTATGATNPAAAPSSSGGLMSWFGRGDGPKNAQPVEPPSAANNYMALGAGGVLGGKQEHCTGTLCDAYYGVVGSDDKGAGKQTAASVTPVAEAAVPHRHIVHESETRPKCSSPAADPWRCFR